MPLDPRTVERMREAWSGYPPCCRCGAPGSRIHQREVFCHQCRERYDKTPPVEVSTSGHPTNRYGRRM